MTTNSKQPGRGALMFAIAVLLLCAGCEQDNPRYCNADKDCQDTGREGYDKARPYCHAQGHFCHAGCFKDEDCSKKTAANQAWFDPDRPRCNLATNDCVASVSDGGPDGKPRDMLPE